MKVSYFLRDDGACGFYRLEQPLKALAYYTKCEVMKSERGDPITDIVRTLDSDIFVFPRPCEPNWLDIFSMAQERGAKIVVDHDDNMFDVSHMSPHYKDFGVADVTLVIDGKKVKMWEDGTNYDKKANQEKLDGFKRALEACDMVTVTTEILADVYREYNDNVVALPNTINSELWKPLPLKKENPGEIKLHWGGGSSHAADIMIVNEALRIIVEKYPHVTLSFAGCIWEGSLKGIPEHRIQYIPWTHTQAYPYRMAIHNPDISFIPLEDNQFNRCKSNLKWLEMSALSVPSVTSFVSPYKEVYDGANGAFVDNTTEAWVEGLSALIEDPILRATMGGKAQDTVKRKFDIHKEYVQWEKAYKELINGN